MDFAAKQTPMVAITKGGLHEANSLQIQNLNLIWTKADYLLCIPVEAIFNIVDFKPYFVHLTWNFLILERAAIEGDFKWESHQVADRK